MGREPGQRAQSPPVKAGSASEFQKAPFHSGRSSPASASGGEGGDLQRTLAIIKPDAVKHRAIGAILQRYEQEGFRIVEMKLVRLTRTDTETFYAVHRARPFFDSLVTFMISGPVVVVLLDMEQAIERHRALMGATDPAKAAEGTLRKLYGRSIEENAVHGSDSAATAKDEISFFFGPSAVAS